VGWWRGEVRREGEKGKGERGRGGKKRWEAMGSDGQRWGCSRSERLEVATGKGLGMRKRER